MHAAEAGAGAALRSSAPLRPYRERLISAPLLRREIAKIRMSPKAADGLGSNSGGGKSRKTGWASVRGLLSAPAAPGVRAEVFSYGGAKGSINQGYAEQESYYATRVRHINSCEMRHVHL
eukprot:scaffold307_cov390-Prasinococcus_capsulatus_cf.AAC.17